jgi:hypothetical protein
MLDRRRLAALILGIGCVVIGLGLLLLKYPLYQESLESAEWPDIQAAVFDTSMEQSSAAKWFEPQISYMYQVDGKSYKAKGVLGAYSTRELAANDLKHFALGTKINVIYDPKNPQRSFLRAGENLAQLKLMLYIAGAVITLGVLVLLILAIVLTTSKEKEDAEEKESGENKYTDIEYFS